MVVFIEQGYQTFNRMSSIVLLMKNYHGKALDEARFFKHALFLPMPARAGASERGMVKEEKDVISFIRSCVTHVRYHAWLS